MAEREPALIPSAPCDAAHAQEAQPEVPSRLNFALIAYTFFVIITGGGLPTPLYVVYQKLWGFPSSTLTIIFGAYAAGLLVTLLFFRRTADRLGHKWMMFSGVIGAIASTLVFLFATNVGWLIVARILSGMSVGLTASTASAGLTVFEPSGNKRRAAKWITMITALGVGVGPFYAGFLIEYEPYPRMLSFWVLLALLVAAIPATLLIRERVHPAPRVPKASGKLFEVPSSIREVFRITCLGAFVGFTLAGMFSGLAPSFLGTDLHITNHAVGGTVVLLMFGSAAIAQIGLESVSRLTAMRLGGMLVPIGLAAIATATWTGLAIPFFIGTIVCGSGFGLCLMGGLGLLNQAAPREHRAEILSGFYVAAYLGLSVPVFGIGLLADSVGLRTAVAALSIVISLLTLPVILASKLAPPAMSPAEVSKASS